MSNEITRFFSSRINNLLARGVAKLFESSGNWQVTLLKGETLSGIEHPQEFGFASKAPNGGTVYTISFGGQRENTVAILISKSDGRPDIEQGQVALHDESGTCILLDGNGTVRIKNATKFIVEDGDVADNSLTTPTIREMRELFNNHVHTIPTGETSAPTTTM